MKRKFSDKEILKLLSSLKNTDNDYPTEMIQSRRDMYLKQAAAMAVLSGMNGTGAHAGEGGASGSGTAASAGLFSLGTFFETALVITIAMEAGVAAYIYRDKIADFINSTLFPKVEVAVNPAGDSTYTPAVIPVTGGKSVTETPTITPTVTVTVTSTPFPVLVPESQDDPQSDNLKVESTPPPKENPGNHYGNTPKPERTKDSDNNSSEDKDKDKNK